MVEFYDVKTRQKVQVDEANVTKTKFVRQTKDGKTLERYAFKGAYEGRKLIKFVNKETWDAHNGAVE